MKRITSIALILLLSSQCFYQLGIATYFALNRDYIAEVLCINRDKPVSMCNGQCFLRDKLDITSDETGTEAPLPEKKAVEFPVFVVSDSQEPTLPPCQHNAAGSVYIYHTSTAYVETPFHPPSGALFIRA